MIWFKRDVWLVFSGLLFLIFLVVMFFGRVIGYENLDKLLITSSILILITQIFYLISGRSIWANLSVCFFSLMILFSFGAALVNLFSLEIVANFSQILFAFFGVCLVSFFVLPYRNTVKIK